MADRSKKDKLSALAQLKRARQGGKRDWKVSSCFPETRLSLTRRVQSEVDTLIYDEVTEEQYKSVVAGRLAQDDFVEDDGVGGYMDNGMDDVGNGNYASEDEDEDEVYDRRYGEAKRIV